MPFIKNHHVWYTQKSEKLLTSETFFNYEERTRSLRRLIWLHKCIKSRTYSNPYFCMWDVESFLNTSFSFKQWLHTEEKTHYLGGFGSILEDTY